MRFVTKEFIHILRDKRTMLILLVMPIVQIILFGFALSTEVKNGQIAIFDLSKDEVTQQLTARFQASSYFDIVQNIRNPNEIETAFNTGKVAMVIVFDEHFSENMLHNGEASIQLLTDATDPNQATLMANYVTQIIMAYQLEMIQLNRMPMQIIPQVKMLYNPQSKSAYNFVPGVIGLIMMIICAMMTSVSIVREKETGSMEVLLVSPIKPIYIIISKAVPYFVLSLINLFSILLLSSIVFDVPISGSFFWLLIISCIFIIVALALGLLISSAVKTQVLAVLFSGIGLTMPAIVLSGMVFPIDSMPQILQWLSCIVPARWFIAAIRKLMIQGVEVKFVVKEILILTGMAIVLLTISLKKFKIRL